MAWCNTGLGSYQKWFVGNELRDILLSNSAITAQVNEHIYPLIAPEKTEGDFIIYMRRDYSKKLTKQGVYADVAEVAFVAISDNYDNALQLAAEIDNTLSGTHILEGDVRVDVKLSTSSEIFDDNKYVETLVFTIE